MIEKGKKILSSFLIFFLLFGTFSTGYAANNTKDKNILKKIEKIREKQKLKEKFYGEKIGEAQKLIQNYEGEVNKKGKLYKQKNKAKIEKALRDAQKTKLEILKTSNEKLKENFEIELKNEFSPDLIKDLNLEPNYMYEFQALSNDPQINTQWGISNILGNVQNAELSYNGSDVKIAIIDTGIDFSIPDLVGSTWKDPSCVNHENILIPNGCNGGYDFINNDTNPYPDEKLSHGSNVASIIASEINNSTAGASFAGNKAKLMSLRVAGGSNAYITSENIAKAIYFAVYNDAKIINMSLGGPTYSQVMYDALAFAKEKGVLVIAAAGNYASNNDTTPIYPANYTLDNIISVASVNSSNTLSSFSNYGANTVDLAAPGENITTYGVNAAQQTINGTSFSTPFTVSVAARYASQDTSLDYLQLKNKILEKSESQSLLAGKVIANKQLRIDPNSLTLLQTPPENPEPAPVDPAPVTPPVQPPTQDTPSTLKEEYAQMMLDVAKLRQGNVSLEKQNNHISIQELGSLETKLSDFYFAEKAYLDKRSDISSEKKTQYLNLLKDQLGLTKDFNTSYKAFLQSKQSTQSENSQNIDEISQKILKDLGVATPKEETQILSDMSNFRFEENKASSQTMKSAKIIQTDESLTPQTNIGKNFIQGVIPETFAPLKKQDFGEDTNIVIDESIKNLAGELGNNPVNIYNYVKNNIHFEAYYGSKKSSINCLQDKSCNDIDQANLTIALLRASGIPARYKTNSILVTKQNVQKLLGVNDLKLAFLILSKANIPVYRVNNGTPTPPADLSQVNMDADTHIVFEWTGVEALIKHNDVGGNYSNDVFFDLSQDDAGLQSQIAEKDGIEWVYFDTAFQFVTVNNPAKNNTDLFTAGSVSIPTFFSNYLKNLEYTDVITTLKNIFYQTVPSLVSAPAGQKETEYKKYLYSPTPTKSKVDFIPLGLPYQIVEGTLANGEVLSSKTLSQLGNNQVQNYEIIIKRQSNDEIVFQNSYTVDQINNVPFSLDYVGFTQADRDTISNYGSLNLTPSSLVDLGIVIDSQAIPSSTLTQEKSVKIGEGLIITYNYKLGSTLLDSSSKFSIGGNQEGMYFTFGKLRADNLTDNSQVLLAGNWAIAKKYLQKVQTGGDELASMLNVQNDLNVARAVVTQNRILNTTNGIATNFDFKGLSIDSHIFVKDFSRKNYTDNATRSPNFRKLFGLLASQEEATIFQEITGLSAISTVNGLQYAHSQSGSYTVHTITPSNISLIDTLEFSLNTKNAMKAYINEGKTLITPNKPIENQNWKGVLYLAIDQATGEGVYAIGEQVVGNGGWTVDELTQEIYVPIYENTIPDNEIENYLSDENKNIIGYTINGIFASLDSIVSDFLSGFFTLSTTKTVYVKRKDGSNWKINDFSKTKIPNGKISDYSNNGKNASYFFQESTRGSINCRISNQKFIDIYSSNTYKNNNGQNVYGIPCGYVSYTKYLNNASYKHHMIIATNGAKFRSENLGSNNYDYWKNFAYFDNLLGKKYKFTSDMFNIGTVSHETYKDILVQKGNYFKFQNTLAVKQYFNPYRKEFFALDKITNDKYIAENLSYGKKNYEILGFPKSSIPKNGNEYKLYTEGTIDFDDGIISKDKGWFSGNIYVVNGKIYSLQRVDSGNIGNPVSDVKINKSNQYYQRFEEYTCTEIRCVKNTAWSEVAYGWEMSMDGLAHFYELSKLILLYGKIKAQQALILLINKNPNVPAETFCKVINSNFYVFYLLGIRCDDKTTSIFINTTVKSALEVWLGENVAELTKLSNTIQAQQKQLLLLEGEKFNIANVAGYLGIEIFLAAIEYGAASVSGGSSVLVKEGAEQGIKSLAKELADDIGNNLGANAITKSQKFYDDFGNISQQKLAQLGPNPTDEQIKKSLLESADDAYVKSGGKSFYFKNPCSLGITLQSTSIQAGGCTLNWDNLFTHLKGGLKTNGDPDGFHTILGVGEKKGRINSIIKPEAQGCYQAKVSIFDQTLYNKDYNDYQTWLKSNPGKTYTYKKIEDFGRRAKKGQSTFFPDKRDEARIKSEIEFGMKEIKTFKGEEGKVKYYGQTTDGILLEFKFDSNGNITSVFPNFSIIIE